MKADIDVLIACADARQRVAIDRALALVQTSAKVWAVGHGRNIASKLARGRIDCLILDSELPGPCATELVGQIREQGFDVPIILLIAALSDDADVIPRVAGVNECVEKTELAAGARRLAAAIRVGVAEGLASRAKKELARRAIYDQLTGLPNRVLLLDRLQQLIAIAGREGHFVALLMMDLDGFGDINKSLGHDVGDRLLQEVSARLRAVARDSDTVARVDGDAFACVVTTGTHQAGAVVVADKVRQAMARPFVIQGRELAIGLRIGIAVYPLHATDGATLLRRAAAATAAAKLAPSGVEVYAGDDNRDLRRLSLVSELRTATDRGQMAIHFQPKVAFSDGQLNGVEVLLRWLPSDREPIPPDQFIPLAEETGSILPLTRWVLRGVLAQYGEWRHAGHDVAFSVNLSPLTLQDRNFPDEVGAMLDRGEMPPHRLTFEITEGAIMSDISRATQTLERLASMGVHLSIDDFGTGYSSLANLQRLPVEEIKVDKSFVCNMTTRADDAVIVRSVVELGRNLGLHVVAEGVEDQATWAQLAGLDCPLAQGYFIGRPVDAPTMTAWLRRPPWSFVGADSVGAASSA